MTGLANIVLPKIVQETSWPVSIGCLVWGGISGIFGARFRRWFLAIWAGLLGAAVGGYIGGAYGSAGATIGASVTTGVFTLVAILLEFPMMFLMLALVGAGAVFLFAGAGQPVNWVLAGLVGFAAGLLGVQSRSRAYAPLFSVYSAILLVVGAGPLLGYDTLKDLHAALMSETPHETFLDTQWRQILSIGGLTMALWLIQSSVEGVRKRGRDVKVGHEDTDPTLNPLLTGPAVTVAAPAVAVRPDRPAAAAREVKPAKRYPRARFVIVLLVLAVVGWGTWQEIDCRRDIQQAARLAEDGQRDESVSVLAETILANPLSYSAKTAQAKLHDRGQTPLPDLGGVGALGAVSDPAHMLALYWAPVIYLGLASAVWFLAAVFHGRRRLVATVCGLLALAGVALVVARLCRWKVLTWNIPPHWIDRLVLSDDTEFLIAIGSLGLALAMLCWPEKAKKEPEPTTASEFLLGPGYAAGPGDPS